MAVLLSVLGVIGLILKWILFVVLGILAFVLLILLIVLLCPLTYRIDATRKTIDEPTDEEKERTLLGGLMEARVKVTYLFHLVRVEAAFVDKKLTWSAKVAWKKVAGSEEETAPSLEEDMMAEPDLEPFDLEDEIEEIEEKTETQEETVAQPEPAEEKPAEPEPVEESPKEPEPEAPTEPEPEPPAKPAEPEPEPERPEAEEPGPEEVQVEVHEVTLDEKIDQIIQKLDEISDKLWDLPDKVDETVDKKLEPVRKYMKKFDDFYDKEKALKAVLKLLKRELKPLVPKRANAQIDWGTGDPYLTSKIEGYQVALAPLVAPRKTRKRSFVSRPYYMDKFIDFDISISDWFMIGGFIPPLIAALLNIHIWHLIKFVKNLKK